MFVIPKSKTKYQKQNKKQVPKKILDKEINQIKQLRTAGYLVTKDHDQVK